MRQGDGNFQGASLNAYSHPRSEFAVMRGSGSHYIIIQARCNFLSSTPPKIVEDRNLQEASLDCYILLGSAVLNLLVPQIDLEAYANTHSWVIKGV